MQLPTITRLGTGPCTMCRRRGVDARSRLSPVCAPLQMMRTMVAVAVWLPFAAGSLSSQPAAPKANLVRGHVVSSMTGLPVINARVALSPRVRETRTDSLGAFVLKDVPAGVHGIVVTALGFSPARSTVSVVAGLPVVLDVELEPIAPVLERVVTAALVDAPRNAAMEEFESRRAAGLGRYLTRAQLLRDRGRSLEAVLSSRVPGLRIVNDRNAKVAASGRTSGRLSSARACYLNVFVDGVLRYDYIPDIPKEPFDLRTLEASMIAGIEVHTVATLPAEFNLGGNAACGALLIWLQH